MATYTVTTTPEQDSAIAYHAEVLNVTPEEHFQSGVQLMLDTWVQMQQTTPADSPPAPRTNLA